MVRTHPSTPAQRAQWVSQLIAHDGEYGVVTALSRRSGVSRQTLYAWKAQGWHALEHVFLPPAVAPVVTPALERQILTLLVEGHSSYSGIQACLHHLTQQQVSLGTIAAVVQAAEQRALDWMATHAPPTTRTIALDEIYGNNRRGAYLNVVDTQSWAVWAAEGPVPVDADSWTLVLWFAQARGLRWHATSSDGGKAIQAACRVVDPTGQHGRDVWHVFHTCAQVQGRLERHLAQLQDQSPTVVRQAARVAGKPPQGRHPKTDLVAHAAEVRQAQWTAEAVRFLGAELQRLLEVVVLDRHGLLDAARRQQELDALLALLAEVGTPALPQARGELKRLHQQVRKALPGLLAFVAPLERVQQDVGSQLEARQLALVAWAWQRRAILGPRTEQLLAGLPERWRPAARVLMAAWGGAVRASSAAENWHSILRPHLAVHRTLSAGLLALLAVWHNHRVFPRGAHAGFSPLQLSGMGDAPTDWLVALGYPSGADAARSTARPVPPIGLALAA